MAGKEPKVTGSGPGSRKRTRELHLTPRWSHREKFKDEILQGSQFKLFDPCGMTVNRKAIKPQPYPDREACFYFKPAKRFAIVYQGKIGTFEQWGNELGVDPVKLRMRVRVCGMPIQEAFTPEALNVTDHSETDGKVYRYCFCEFCAKRRAESLQKSLKPIQMPNAQDHGKVFRRSDSVILIRYKRRLADLVTLEKRTGVSRKTLYARIFILGWPLKRVFQTGP